ncbi:MAG: hypothetical protein V7L05_08210 [Nostoc sp.]|uniref:hypothetical protein n=1 Tax=Nostoc sp. TaxID=1180 RepID=UPI002FF88A0E
MKNAIALTEMKRRSHIIMVVMSVISAYPPQGSLSQVGINRVHFIPCHICQAFQRHCQENRMVIVSSLQTPKEDFDLEEQ